MKSFNQFVVESTTSTLDGAKNIIKTLRTAGFQSYLVGGCVRDTLLGHKPKDYDVATDATPNQVLKLFPHADQVGAHFGVVIENGIEIATFRSDGAYGDGRRPDQVHYEKDPMADASRRDFTVNAMFMDPFSGHILDYFGGQDDLRKKVLRAVGDPYKRFQEDHLRMMRAVRFASKLGFTIDPATLEAMSGHAPNIAKTAVERTTIELTKSLGHDPAKTLHLMMSGELLPHVLPEVANLPQHAFQVTKAIVDSLPPGTSSELALAALFSQVNLRVVGNAMKRLKLANDEIVHVLGILQLQPRIAGLGRNAANVGPTLDVAKKVMRDKFFPEALRLFGLQADVVSDRENLMTFHGLSQWFPTMSHGDLNPTRLVTGDDLLDLGLKAGKMFKEILDAIEVGQLNGSIMTREQALTYVQSLIKL
jgi:poly(A) polymerase